MKDIHWFPNLIISKGNNETKAPKQQQVLASYIQYVSICIVLAIYIYTHYYTSCTLMLVSWGDGSSKRYKLVYIPVKSPYPNFLGTKNLSYPLISTAQTDYI